jgi:hypothetical protein
MSRLRFRLSESELIFFLIWQKKNKKKESFDSFLRFINSNLRTKDYGPPIESSNEVSGAEKPASANA